MSSDTLSSSNWSFSSNGSSQLMEAERPLTIKHRKTVRFSSAVRVILVPTREEYQKEVGHLIWWTDADYIQFKQSAVDEIVKFLKKHATLSIKEAQTRLYQPHHSLKVLSSKVEDVTEKKRNSLFKEIIEHHATLF